MKPNGELRSAEQILHVPSATLADIHAAMSEADHGWRGGRPEGEFLPELGREAVEVAVKYSQYLERQEREVERMRSNRMARIPPGIQYSDLPCLSTEEVEKLTALRPETIHDASLIPGITPKALLYLFNHMARAQRGDASSKASAGSVLADAPPTGAAAQ